MAVTPLITRADLAARFTDAVVKQLADDIGDDSATATVLADVLAEATSIGISHLRSAWPTPDQVATLVAEDPAVKGAFCDIAIGLLGRRRQEFLANGATLYSPNQAAAEARLKNMAKGADRPAGENEAGANPIVQTRTNRDERVFTFQGNSRNPKAPGGF